MILLKYFKDFIIWFREIDVEVDAPELEEVDVDSVTGVETYTWAGYTRVRATSLVDGQLRGPGFVSLTRTDEDQELDIEGDDDDINQSHGKPQYTEADLILPQPGNIKKINQVNWDLNFIWANAFLLYFNIFGIIQIFLFIKALEISWKQTCTP